MLWSSDYAQNQFMVAIMFKNMLACIICQGLRVIHKTQVLAIRPEAQCIRSVVGL